MLTRVSDNMKFTTMTDNMFKVQTKYAEIQEKLATEKEINRPSDDPTGMAKILGYRSSRAAIANYQDNVTQGKSWLTVTETKLSSIEDLLVNAKELAISQGTATASADTRANAAATLQPLIDEMLSAANATYGDRYIFGGSKTDTDPFSSSSNAASVGTAKTGRNNSFDGTVTSGGTYTGTKNKTYALKVVTGGALATATYQVSSDGGKTWGTVQTDLSSTVTLGDGITLDFTAGATNPAANDVFYVDGTTAGYYNGNGNQLTVETGKGVDFGYNISGEEALTNRGAGTVDVFTVLNDFKTALTNNDISGIQTAIDNLESARTEVSQYVSKCGSLSSSLDITSSNLTALDNDLSDLNSNVEDADMAKLITELTMKQNALEASYSVAAKVGNLSIIDFLS